MAVPHPSAPIADLPALPAAFEVAIVPSIECPTGDAELVQRALGREVRQPDDPDVLEISSRELKI